jgi:drug/metabolite transporter (DMT)-like permease
VDKSKATQEMEHLGQRQGISCKTVWRGVHQEYMFCMDGEWRRANGRDQKDSSFRHSLFAICSLFRHFVPNSASGFPQLLSPLPWAVATPTFLVARKEQGVFRESGAGKMNGENMSPIPAAGIVTRTGASRRPYGYMLLGCAIFAVMGELVHALRPYCDWRWIALARSFLNLVFAMLLARLAGQRLVVWRPPSLWLRSLAGGVSLVCTFFALTHLPVADVLTLTNTFPLWVAVLSWPILGERPSAGVWLAVCCGVVGVALVQQPHLATGNPAVLVALGAAVATALAMLGLHQLEGLGAWPIIAHFSGVATLFCLAALLLPPPPFLAADCATGKALVLLLGVGLTATVGQFFLTWAFTRGAPSKVAVVGLSQVVLALILDMLLWQRSLEPLMGLGMVLILAPTAWVLLHRQARSVPVPDLCLPSAPNSGWQIANGQRHDSRSQHPTRGAS